LSRRPTPVGGLAGTASARRAAAAVAAACAGLALSAAPADARIVVPSGIGVSTVASGIGRPTNIVFAPDGGLWTTSSGYSPDRSDGVWASPDGERPRQAASGLHLALGLVWLGGELYVTHKVRSAGRVTALSGWDGRRFHRRRVVVRALPTGRHDVDSIVVGPGGRLYAGVGSVGDAERGPSPLSASIVSFSPSGRGLRVEARGLRNPYGLALVPGTSDLLVTDNGRDDLGPRLPPDLVHLVRPGARRGAAPWYGFPGCWGQGGPPCRGAVPPLARLPAHAAAGGIAVARRFGRYGLSAFVAENGSNLLRRPSGSDILRVALRRRGHGYRATVHPFARGFRAHDPLGAAIGPDGALYATLWRTGAVVRFAPR
jgi:glucose/arabinose dehydrogenase